jgi:hypothetical protein
MNEEAADYERLSEKYFSEPFESRNVAKVKQILSVALTAVQANPENIEMFEEINLNMQGAVQVPESNNMHGILEDVSEELLGWEDLEKVLGSKKKAIEAMSNWCKYVRSIIAKLD